MSVASSVSSPTGEHCESPCEFSRAVASLTMAGTPAVVEIVDQCVREVAARSFQTPHWIKVCPFGSSALNAAVEGSDIDLYGEHSSLFPLFSAPSPQEPFGCVFS